jgi:hypothetical protein
VGAEGVNQNSRLPWHKNVIAVNVIEIYIAKQTTVA